MNTTAFPISVADEIMSDKGLKCFDKAAIKRFLEAKLKISGSNLGSATDPNAHMKITQKKNERSETLYQNLLTFGVLKPVKVKVKGDWENIEKKVYNVFGQGGILTSTWPKFPTWPKFHLPYVNRFLEENKINVLTDSQNKDLVDALRKCGALKAALGGAPLDIVDALSKCGEGLGGVQFCIVSEIEQQQLPDSLIDVQKQAVVAFFKSLLKSRDNVSTIISALKTRLSTIQGLDTPDISFGDIHKSFSNTAQEDDDVLRIFKDNQCQWVIRTGEQQWSWKTITVVTTASLLGVAQIVGGAVLAVTSVGSLSFVASALISEGVSDLTFAVEGLYSGHCNFAQFCENKLMSLAITIATAGVGSLLAGGEQASRYAYKALGTAAEVAGENVSRVMAKQVLKKVGKKIATAVVDATMNVLVNKFISGVSDGIEAFSDIIVKSFETLSGNCELKMQMSVFLSASQSSKLNSIKDAEKQLNQLIQRVMQETSFTKILDKYDKLAFKALTVFSRGYNQAAKKLQMKGGGLAGKAVMKGLGIFRRCAPLATEGAKIGLVKCEIELFQKAFIEELEKANAQAEAAKSAAAAKASSESSEAEEADAEAKTQFAAATTKADIDAIVDRQLKQLLNAFRDQVTQRTKSLARNVINQVTNRLQSFATDKLKHGYSTLCDRKRLDKLEKLDLEQSRASTKNYNTVAAKYQMQRAKILSHSRSPRVFAKLIRSHNAELGPAFAIPALERLSRCRIVVVDPDNKPLVGTDRHGVDGHVPIVKIIYHRHPNGGIGHYESSTGENSQDGGPALSGVNNCLIAAVQAEVRKANPGALHGSAQDIRNRIADLCEQKPTETQRNPIYDYICNGVAGNYIQIGMGGGGGVLEGASSSSSSRSEEDASVAVHVQEDRLRKLGRHHRADWGAKRAAEALMVEKKEKEEAREKHALLEDTRRIRAEWKEQVWREEALKEQARMLEDIHRTRAAGGGARGGGDQSGEGACAEGGATVKEKLEALRNEVEASQAKMKGEVEAQQVHVATLEAAKEADAKGLSSFVGTTINAPSGDKEITYLPTRIICMLNVREAEGKLLDLQAEEKALNAEKMEVDAAIRRVCETSAAKQLLSKCHALREEAAGADLRAKALKNKALVANICGDGLGAGAEKDALKAEDRAKALVKDAETKMLRAEELELNELRADVEAHAKELRAKANELRAEASTLSAKGAKAPQAKRIALRKEADKKREEADCVDAKVLMLQQQGKEEELVLEDKHRQRAAAHAKALIVEEKEKEDAWKDEALVLQDIHFIRAAWREEARKEQARMLEDIHRTRAAGGGAGGGGGEGGRATPSVRSRFGRLAAQMRQNVSSLFSMKRNGPKDTE